MSEQSEPLVLINLFSMPPELVDGFVANWERNIDKATGAPGFRGTRLHRSIDPDARYPVVNIARWDSVDDWQAMFARNFAAPVADNATDNAANDITDNAGAGAPGRSDKTPADGEGRKPAVSADPNLYRVVHVTADPHEG